MEKSKITAESLERELILDENFLSSLMQKKFPKPKSSTSLLEAKLSPQELLELFDAQLISRHLDLLAREYKRINKAYYTIGSSGHEGNAAIAMAFRHSDMAFLHYRSGAFMLMRAKQAAKAKLKASKTVPLSQDLFEGSHEVDDLLLSFFAAKEDPISGGRHKVFGSFELNIPPQTSTIASHLPKAVGAAASIHRASRLNIPSPLLKNSVILCSFGDASTHHSTALGAFNQAQWIASQHYPLPIVFICEDNGLGISVSTPENWVESMMSIYPHWHYIKADGLNLADVYKASLEAENIAREHRKPVFLHMKCVRLMGHAGTDIETQYRSEKEIREDESNDPLLHTARMIIENKILDEKGIIDLYEAAKEKVKIAAEKLVNSSPLSSAEEIMSSIIPPKKSIMVPAWPSKNQREAIFGESITKLDKPLNMAQQINFALTDLMLQYPNVIVFGEDVAKKGGVYRVTADLLERFGSARVFDSILDEQSILGHALGHAQNGFIPIPEIQYLAYLHNAEDQLRGEAATLSFFSKGQFTNPMVIRIPGLAYQKGFGGHFHNDNSLAVLRDIPGIIVACPSSGEDAAKILRECVRLAHEEQRVVVFVEPIALYMIKGGKYPELSESIPFGELGVEGDSQEYAIITYGNGHHLSKEAKEELFEKHHISIKLIDLRWLHPINEEALIREIQNIKNILIVDETRDSGGIAERISKIILAHRDLASKNIHFLTAKDSFITLGTSWEYLLPSRVAIIQKILSF